MSDDSVFLEKNFRAFTDTTVAPDLVDVRKYGHHSSFVQGNERIWVFENGIGRDEFLEAVERGEFRREKK